MLPLAQPFLETETPLIEPKTKLLTPESEKAHWKLAGCFATQVGFGDTQMAACSVAQNLTHSLTKVTHQGKGNVEDFLHTYRWGKNETSLFYRTREFFVFLCVCLKS